MLYTYLSCFNLKNIITIHSDYASRDNYEGFEALILGFLTKRIQWGRELFLVWTLFNNFQKLFAKKDNIHK